MLRTKCLLKLALAVAFTAAGAWAQAKPAAPDITKQPTLFVVGYAHLDTQWRWDYPTTIRDYLTSTMHVNFDYFEKYPHYIFNFSGANRYRMMKEYYPADYERVKQYVKAGRWFPSGSSMEEEDVNSPSAESIIRQILYGKEYFRQEFGKTSAEFELPDCFGFPSSLPTLLAHTGIKGFSTQKLVWGSSAPAGGPNSPEQTPLGTPFNVGVWVGPDGKSVIAALNPGSYSQQVEYDLSKSPAPPANPRQRRVDWPARIERDGKASGLFADYMYYGTGDIGGAAQEYSVKLMEAIATKSETVLPTPRRRGRQQDEPAPQPGPPVLVGDGPVRVIPATAEQLFLDITPAMEARLPRYTGELELTNHSAGSITSEAYMKRWNRKNELLADAAEKASVAAAWLGGRPYPIDRLNAAWTLVMGGQFHDIIPGTSIPKAYEYSWNDELLAMNQFSGVMTSGTEAVASAMNTEAKGAAVVVYNPLAIEREDVVEAQVAFPNGAPKAVRVIGPDGKQTPAQIEGGKVLFVAKAPSAGYAVYDVEAADAPEASTLKATEDSIENARYRVTLDEHGDVASIFDKTLGRDLLLTPSRLEIKTDNPAQWPAWNMDFEDQVRAPRAYVGGPAKIRIAENGPARVSLEVTRATEGSTFVQTVSLSAGDAGNRVEFRDSIDWNTKDAHLKAVFPLTATNAVATYNWDVGTIERGTDNPKKFEVPSHQWVDLTDTTGAFGATMLTDCKFGSDKPDENTLRLTLIRTPGVRGGYPDQATQDIGHHEILYGLAGHKGDWRQGQTDWQALRLNQPLIALESSKHPGALGKTFSLVNVSNSRVRVMALKRAEKSDEFVVRLVEASGKAEPGVRIHFAAPVTAAREVNGAEEAVGPATVQNGALVTSFTAYQPRTFAVKLAAAPVKSTPVESQEIKLACDRVVATKDGEKSADNFSLPAEMLPSELSYAGVKFALSAKALVPNGQTIDLPAGNYNRVYVIAASADGDQTAEFKAGGKAVDLTVQDWTGYIGQWDNRIWQGKEMVGLKPGYIKPAQVAWFASHHHDAAGANEPYQYSYLFAYPIDLPAGAKTLTLPANDKIRVMAISVANEPGIIANNYVGDRLR